MKEGYRESAQSWSEPKEGQVWGGARFREAGSQKLSHHYDKGSKRREMG